jgi:anti-sigma factor RsiW
MNPEHVTRENLLLYVDGELGQADRKGVEAHLRICPLCARAASGMERIGEGMRRIPLERTSAGFTASVLRELGLVSRPRLRLRAIEAAGALVAMVVVVGVLLSVFFATGVLKQDQVTEVQSVAGVFVEKGGEMITDGVSAVGGWLGSYLPSGIGKGVGISITALVVMALLAVVDRYVGRGQQG